MSEVQDHNEARLGEDLFEHYAVTPGVFDEMLAAPAGVRPHWRQFIEALRRQGRHELTSRWDNGRRIIREHGVTYNVYGDPQGMDRPWGLDLVPLLIPAADWARVEAGLVQRSRLFNLILADLYGGRQRVLRDGFLPPELVYANPGFLRPCRGIATPKNVYLHLLGCDLARSMDGQWWVLADRTQAPSGAGYALENRTVISRVLPDEIRDRNVQRLGGFFRAEREMLLELAPRPQGTPSVVLLTPGPHNETYFEHAFLARHLGFPLVEGADLTVRDQRVFLKTLEGLQPVDVILRRVDDSFCDPLELRGESFLGVPGLVEATRSGNVAVANALGSGLLESPAFLAFLPGLCRHLLDEDMLLPSVATWWCGQAEELGYVLEHLEALVVKPAFGPPGRQPWFGGGMTHAERARLTQLIKSHPREFVGQERVVLSRAPVWVNDRFEARSVVVRTYVANGGGSLSVLPGGLTRVSRTQEDPVVSMQSGGGSKDTWVVGEKSQSRGELVPAGVETRAAERIPGGTPSRAADNLFWLGRYTERLEQTLRVLQCVISRLIEETSVEEAPELGVMAELMERLEMLPARLGARLLDSELQQQVLHLVYKPDVAGSVRALLDRIRFIASTVRDRFSGDTWRILGRLELDARTRPGRLPLADTMALIHNLVVDLAAFNGMEMENMTRGHAWLFLDLGRRLERSMAITGLVQSALAVSVQPGAGFEPILEIADSLMTYRRRYFSEARLPGLLELLLRDESNPRALAFQLQVLDGHEAALPQDVMGRQEEAAGGLMKRLRGQVANTDFEALAAVWSPERPGQLGSLLAGWTAELATFSDHLTGRYFSHIVHRIS